MNALLCSGLDAGYAAGRPVVRNFDLTLAAGEVVALLGPNGAGKTTVMLTLAGLIPRLGGSVAVKGSELSSGKARATARAGLVLVPDNRELFTTLTTRQNLELGGRRGGTTIDEVLAYLPALERRLTVNAGALSGGEQQMLAIGRAIMQDPAVLLIDELSMGLAPVIVENLLPVLRKVAEDKATAVLLVEQHVRLALQASDRAIVLAHGDVVLSGSAAELAAAPETLEAAYLGEQVA